MSTSSNGPIIDAWCDQPAPLLPVLHAYHDRDKYLSDTAIAEVAAGMKIPLAELFATITFYHHFSRSQPGQTAPRVCTGPICCLRGSRKLLDSLESATPMPCSGRCDEPIPVLIGHDTKVGTPDGSLRQVPSPIPAPNPGKCEECVFRGIREPGRIGIEGYRKMGGYHAFGRAMNELSPQQLLNLIADSGLAGRGGAGFPTGQKWQAVADAPGNPKTIVCNADEGEPGCFKDRSILDYDPHSVIEGMLLAAYASGATRGFLYLRYEYPETLQILERAIQEAESANLLGHDILGSGLEFHLYLRRGAGAYICGEEGSLLNSLEGRHPFPRNRPPFPVTHGYDNLPTVVNNVETLASAPPIVLNGAEWYQSLGIGDHTGTKLISLSGDIKRPGNYEVPIGLPLPTLLNEWAGGGANGKSIQAVTMAGLSGGFLAGDDLNVSLDEPSIRSRGSFLGAGGIMVFDESRDMIKVAHSAMEFFAEESCGKCFPCRIGTQRLTERLAGFPGTPNKPAAWRREVEDMGKVMMATSACGLGTAAPNITQSLIRYFGDEVDKHSRTVST